jgi:hypothetical protein
MKINKCILLSAIIFLSFSGFTQFVYGDDRIDEIRGIYNKATELEKSDNVFFKHKVELNTMMAVIGLQTTTMTFIYTSEQANPEDPYRLVHRLWKIVIEYNIADAMEYHIEYLYNDKALPVFFFWQEKYRGGKVTGEKRFYFYNKNLISSIMDYEDAQGKKKKYTATSDFSMDDISLAHDAMKKGLDYKALFALLVSAEHWDK